MVPSRNKAASAALLGSQGKLRPVPGTNQALSRPRLPPALSLSPAGREEQPKPWRGGSPPLGLQPGLLLQTSGRSEAGGAGQPLPAVLLHLSPAGGNQAGSRPGGLAVWGTRAVTDLSLGRNVALQSWPRLDAPLAPSLEAVWPAHALFCHRLKGEFELFSLPPQFEH